jgi:hypothetical protein
MFPTNPYDITFGVEYSYELFEVCFYYQEFLGCTAR